MPECRFEFSVKVTNRELSLLGDDVVRQRVASAFLQSIENLVLSKIESGLSTAVCELVPEIDYTLSPFAFSNQFGVEYAACLVVMTPEELEQHVDEVCDGCGFDEAASEALYGEGGGSC